jgi:tRNA-binding protein
MGPVLSEVLVVGVQYPKAESGEAAFVSPAVNAKIGGKLFQNEFRLTIRRNTS